METAGKLVLVLGLALVAVGGLLWGLGRAGFRGLPGDLHWKGDGWELHIPIATCLLVSAVLTLLVWLWQWLRRG